MRRTLRHPANLNSSANSVPLADMRTISVVASLALVVACKGADNTASAPSREPASAAVSFLPKDTGFVVGVSVRQLQTSTLWDRYGALVKASRQEQLTALQTECGIDVLADLDSIIVAGDPAFDERTMVLAITGKWDESKVNACFEKLLAKGERKQLAITKDGKLTRYSVDGGDDVYAYWMGSTVVLTPGALEDKVRLAEVASAATSAKDNAALMTALGKVDAGATLWGGGVITGAGGASKMFSAMEAGTPSSAWVTLRLAKTVEVALGLGFGDEPQAKTTGDHLTSKLAAAGADPTLGPFLAGAKVTTLGTVATIALALDAKQVDRALALVDAQLRSKLPELLRGD